MGCQKLHHTVKISRSCDLHLELCTSKHSMIDLKVVISSSSFCCLSASQQPKHWWKHDRRLEDSVDDRQITGVAEHHLLLFNKDWHLPFHFSYVWHLGERLPKTRRARFYAILFYKRLLARSFKMVSSPSNLICIWTQVGKHVIGIKRFKLRIVWSMF